MKSMHIAQCTLLSEQCSPHPQSLRGEELQIFSHTGSPSTSRCPLGNNMLDIDKEKVNAGVDGKKESEIHKESSFEWKESMLDEFL